MTALAVALLHVVLVQFLQAGFVCGVGKAGDTHQAVAGDAGGAPDDGQDGEEVAEHGALLGVEEPAC